METLQETARLTRMSVLIKDGRGLEVEVDTAATDPACFCMGVRKSGSTMLHTIVLSLARRNGVNIINIPDPAFKAGFTALDWTQADLSSVVRPGNVYVGFRTFPSNFTTIGAWKEGYKIFMFRDPRDALVSQYYSTAYSHSLPSAETDVGAQAAAAFLERRKEALHTDIETYVLKHARAMANTLESYSPMLEDPSCLVLRYEDYIFQKKRLISKILSHFRWTCAPAQLEALIAKIDKVPQAEDQTRFVRRVIPGDHRVKLSPAVIRKLDHQLAPILARYDYY